MYVSSMLNVATITHNYMLIIHLNSKPITSSIIYRTATAPTPVTDMPNQGSSLPTGAISTNSPNQGSSLPTGAINTNLPNQGSSLPTGAINTNLPNQGSSFPAEAIAGFAVGVALGVTVLIIPVLIVLSCRKKVTQQGSKHISFELDSKVGPAHSSEFSPSSPIEASYDNVIHNSDKTDAHPPEEDPVEYYYSPVAQGTEGVGKYSVMAYTTSDHHPHSIPRPPPATTSGNTEDDKEVGGKGGTTHALQSGDAYLESDNPTRAANRAYAAETVAATHASSNYDNVAFGGPIVQPSHNSTQLEQTYMTPRPLQTMTLQ